MGEGKKAEEVIEVGYALAHHGDAAICFYLAESLGVAEEVFVKMLSEGDIVMIDMCMWVAAGLRDASVWEHDEVGERVRAIVRARTGWSGGDGT